MIPCNAFALRDVRQLEDSRSYNTFDLRMRGSMTPSYVPVDRASPCVHTIVMTFISPFLVYVLQVFFIFIGLYIGTYMLVLVMASSECLSSKSSSELSPRCVAARSPIYYVHGTVSC